MYFEKSCMYRTVRTDVNLKLGLREKFTGGPQWEKRDWFCGSNQLGMIVGVLLIASVRECSEVKKIETAEDRRDQKISVDYQRCRYTEIKRLAQNRKDWSTSSKTNRMTDNIKKMRITVFFTVNLINKYEF